MQAAEVIANPVGFARGILRLPLYEWQDSILWDFDHRGVAVAVRAANGSGKTQRIGAPLAIWHAAVFPESLCIVTAGVFRQVKEQFFPAIRSHSPKLAGWAFNETDVETPHGSRIIGFSTDEAGRFEGWHNENLLVIVDEAKSVPDSIFEAIERCQPARLLLMSSPGGPSGFFYEAFHARRRFYRPHAISAFDCPHISGKWIEDQISKYGEDHPLVRSMIFGEFMTRGEDSAVIPYAFVERCLAQPPPFNGKDDTQAFCDFAAGGDENVLALRRGNRVEILKAWRDRDTMRAVGEFGRLFHNHGLREGDISADATGLGAAMCDALDEAGWRVVRVNNGTPPRRDHLYANKGAEIWYEARAVIERSAVILPNDKDLHAQLSARRGWPNSRGRLELESKGEMRSRGIPSPDRADAVLGTIAPSYVQRLLLA